MARKRVIDPEFWSDEEIGKLTYIERILFLGCLCNTDDDGKTKADPLFLKATIFPYDNISIKKIKKIRDKMCDLLRNVQLYEENEIEYIKFYKFHNHQKLKRPNISQIPDPLYKKKAIPAETRREIAKRYGLNKKGSIEAKCRICGKIGKINWLTNSWVCFTDLELDHIIPEAKGGTGEPNNIDLICRSCNRSKGNIHQISTKLAPSMCLKRIEEKRREENRREVNINKEVHTSAQEFFDYFLLKTKKSLRLTAERRAIIERRLKEGRTLEDLKQAVDNFCLDDWPDRHKFIDIIYCIGTRNKIDNLDKWLQVKVIKPQPSPKPKSNCEMCKGSGYIDWDKGQKAKCSCW